MIKTEKTCKTLSVQQAFFLLAINIPAFLANVHILSGRDPKPVASTPPPGDAVVPWVRAVLNSAAKAWVG